MSPGPDDRSGFALLVDWVEGRLEPATAAEVSAAVAAADPRTVATVEWLRDFHELARTVPLHQPPPIIRQSLGRHYARWSRARAALEEPQLQLEASVLFDSRLDLAPVGVRGVDDAEGVVHLAYTTDRADVVVDVSRLGVNRDGVGTVRLDGQVLLTDDASAPIFEAVVTGPSGTRRTIDGDALGRFCLVGVPEDATELRVANSEMAIRVALDLRAEDSRT